MVSCNSILLPEMALFESFSSEDDEDKTRWEDFLSHTNIQTHPLPSCFVCLLEFGVINVWVCLHIVVGKLMAANRICSFFIGFRYYPILCAAHVGNVWNYLGPNSAVGSIGVQLLR